MHRKIVPVFIIFTAVCIEQIVSVPANKTITNEQELEIFCKQSCSKPNWEYRTNGNICSCWVDDAIDDVDADVMKTAAAKQGFKMWLIQRENPVTEPEATEPNPVKREIPSTTTTEEAKPEQSTNVQTTPILQPPPKDVAAPSTSVNIQETKARMSDIDDIKQLKKTTMKKFRTTTGTTEKGLMTLQKPVVQAHDSILGDAFHKSFKNKLTPTINRRQGLVRGCSADSVKLSLQGLKQHAGRLLDRADQGSLTCALMVPELEAMKLTILQMISRASDKKDGERSNIFEQIKERQARLHSRMGHFELPKRPGKLNLVGSMHMKDKLSDKANKAKIITQPKELIDDEE